MPSVYYLIRNLSENVIMPVAGIILTFIACYELIQLVISHNNLANFETWIFFKWVLKTFVGSYYSGSEILPEYQTFYDYLRSMLCRVFGVEYSGETCG